MVKAKSDRLRKLEALQRARQINAIIEEGGIQNQALLDSAGEERPANESHVADLLTRASIGVTAPGEIGHRQAGAAKAKKPARKASPKAKSKPKPKRRK